PRVVRNQSWSQDESKGCGGAVIGCRIAEWLAKTRHSVATFRGLYLRREAAERDGGTGRGFVDGWARTRGGASGGTVAGGASGEQ
ncbi:hypothetical protein PanWU01x14_221080, partial [Parasponia andersonii]